MKMLVSTCPSGNSVMMLLRYEVQILCFVSASVCKMEKYVLSVVAMTEKEELRYASMMIGEQCVMTHGMTMMPL